MATPHRPVHAVRRALKQLGSDLKTARLRRGLPMQVVAERASTTRQTLQRVERGEPSVSMGIYAQVMHALGLLDELAVLAHPGTDEVGLARSVQQLPQRADLPRQFTVRKTDD